MTETQPLVPTRPRTSRILLVALAAIAAFALSCQSQPQDKVAAQPEANDSSVALQPDSARVPTAALRSPRAMPDFALLDLSGNTVRLSDYAGKAVLINFWATWCPPCKAELPDLVELQKQFGGDRFTVIGVSLDQTGMAAVREFVQQQGLNFPVLMGNEDVVIQYGNFRGIPTSFLLDSEHELAHKYTGLVTRKMVETDLASVFDEKA
jgi:peroxiredoxin